MVNRMDDITFCISGWKECGVVRCERHPNNITDRTIPHNFAEFYQTEYCPLEKSTVKDMVEVVRCKDCKHYFTSDLEKAAVYGAECTTVRMRMLPHEYCSRGERE